MQPAAFSYSESSYCCGYFPPATPLVSFIVIPVQSAAKELVLKPATRKENVKENFHYEGTDTKTNSKYQNAIAHYEDVMPFMFQTINHVLNDLSDYEGVTVNPVPQNKTIGQQVGTGTITYSMSFLTTRDNFIPYSRFEALNVNDTYPGQVAAQHVVREKNWACNAEYRNSNFMAKRSLDISKL